MVHSMYRSIVFECVQLSREHGREQMLVENLSHADRKKVFPPFFIFLELAVWIKINAAQIFLKGNMQMQKSKPL
jgi:hypothetical protein